MTKAINPMLERMAQAMFQAEASEETRDVTDYVDLARAAVQALMEPDEAMWGGLARQIVMWLDMEPKTPRALFRHLKASGHDVPDWLRNDPEMRALDHVPSKGTRAVIIHRAMLQTILDQHARNMGEI